MSLVEDFNEKVIEKVSDDLSHHMKEKSKDWGYVLILKLKV